MKRTAENQLTKDSREDDDELAEEGTGFKAASAEAMAGRKIKGLPKRKGAGATPTTTIETEAPKSIFGGFTGFGTTPATSTNGTSDSSAPKPSPFGGFGGFGTSTTSNSSSTTSSLFGSSTAAPSKTSQLFGASIAAASSSVPSTNGTTSAPSFNFKLPAPSAGAPATTSSAAPSFSFGAPSSSSAPVTKSTDSSKDSSVEYYLSLRGLNSSLLAAIESAIAKDPFAKLPMDTIAAAYSKHRSDIEAKAKSTTSASADVEMKTSAPAESPKPSVSNPPAQSTAAPTAFSMPKLPSGGFSFGGNTSSSSTTVPTFNFGTKPAESSSSEQSTAPSSLPFSFKPPAGGFSFGAPSTTAASTTTAAPSLFGAKTDSTPSSTAAPPSLFGGANLFGAAKPKDSEAKTDDKASEPKSLYPFSALESKSPTPTPAPKANPPSFFSFGTTPATTPTQTPGTPDPAEKKPAFSFGFSSGKPPSFSFGSASPGTSTPSGGSLGNPVGFSFGGPKDTIATGAVTPSSATTAGLEAAKEAHDPNAKPTASTVSVISETPADTPTPSQESGDITGAGEENEDTLVSERSKAYKLKEGAWTDIGTGYFKVKKDKDSGKTRILMRTEHGGNVILNFYPHPDLNARVGQKPVNLTMMAFDDGKPLSVVLRFSTSDATQRVLAKLKEAVEAL